MGVWITGGGVELFDKDHGMSFPQILTYDATTTSITVSGGRRATSLTLATVMDVFGDAPFTLAEAAGHGITRPQLRAALERGYLRRLRRGVYVIHQESPLTPHDRARRALAPLGGVPTVITGTLAAELHGLPFIRPTGPSLTRSCAEILVLESQQPRCGYRDVDAVVRRVRRFPDDIVTVDGFTITSILHAAIDVVRMGDRLTTRSRARALALPEALVVLDAATARSGATTGEEATALIARLRHRFRYGTGIRRLDSVAELIEPRSESPFESWSRGHMITFAVPMPLVQYPITGADGLGYRVDFCWPDLKVIGEADGLEKYGETPEEINAAKRREFARQRALEEAGWIVVRWTWQELATNPGAVMRRINRALQQARRARHASRAS